MKSDINKQGAKLDKSIYDPDQDQTKHDYFRSMWSGVDNFVGIGLSRAEAMRRLDSIFGKLTPRRYYTLLASNMYDFATQVSQFEEEEQELKTQLTEANNDILLLAENRAKNNKQQAEQLWPRVDELHEELTREVVQIAQELQAGLEEWRASFLADIDSVKDLESSTGDMSALLQEALERAEQIVAAREQTVEQAIAQKTAPLQKLLGALEDLRRLY